MRLTKHRWLSAVVVSCGTLAWALLPGTGNAAPAEPPEGAAEPDVTCFLAVRDGGASYDCDLAVQVASDSPDPAALTRALLNRARLLTREGNLEAALTDLDRALEGAPDDPEILARVFGNRGNLLLRMGRPAEALAAHGRAIELAPDEPIGYYNRAFAWRALGDDDAAQADVDTAAGLLEGRARGAAAPAPTTPSSGATDAAPGR